MGGKPQGITPGGKPMQSVATENLIRFVPRWDSNSDRRGGRRGKIPLPMFLIIKLKQKPVCKCSPFSTATHPLINQPVLGPEQNFAMHIFVFVCFTSKPHASTVSLPLPSANEQLAISSHHPLLPKSETHIPRWLHDLAALHLNVQ